MKKLFGQRVLAKVLDEDIKTDSGIYLVNNDQSRVKTAEVLMVGPGTNEVKMEVSVGDIITYDKCTGTNMKYDTFDCILLNMKDIIGVE